MFHLSKENLFFNAIKYKVGILQLKPPIGICATLDLDLLTLLILEDKKSEKKGVNRALSDGQGKEDFFFNCVNFQNPSRFECQPSIFIKTLHPSCEFNNTLML